MAHHYPLAGVKGEAVAEIRIVDPSETFDLGDGKQRQRGFTLAQLVQVAGGYSLTFPHDLTGEQVTVDFQHLRHMDHQTTRVTVRCHLKLADPQDPQYQMWGQQIFAKGKLGVAPVSASPRPETR